MALESLLAIVGAFMTSTIALTRGFARHQREMVDRLVGSLESALIRREESLERFAVALENLETAVQENTAVLRRLREVR